MRHLIFLLALASFGQVGEQRTAVIMLNYSDLSETLLTKEHYTALLNTTAADFVRENSYGRIIFKPDVFGWYTADIPRTCPMGSGFGAIVSSAIRAADANVDFSIYPRVIILVPMSKTTITPKFFCGLGGLHNRWTMATADGTFLREVSIVSSVNNTLDATEIRELMEHTLHEWGHGTGGLHDDSLACPASSEALPLGGGYGCVRQDRGNSMSGMSQAVNNIGHWTILNKAQAMDSELLTSEHLTDVTASGTYTIKPLSHQGDGVKGLRILRAVPPNSSVAHEYIGVEYRQPIGFDANNQNMWGSYEGLSITWTSRLAGTAQLLDCDPSTTGGHKTALPVGATFTDAGTGLSVKLMSLNADQAVVEVTLGTVETSPPTAMLTVPAGGATIAGNATLKANATDDKRVFAVEWIWGVQKLAVDFNAPFEATFDSTIIPNGQARICAVAIDDAGFDSRMPYGLPDEACVWVNVQNEAPPPPPPPPPPPSGDTEPPTVTMLTPVKIAGDGWRLMALVADNVGVTRVEFLLNGYLVGTDQVEPFEAIGNAGGKGWKTAYAVAFDAAGNRTQSNSVRFR